MAAGEEEGNWPTVCLMAVGAMFFDITSMRSSGFFAATISAGGRINSGIWSRMQRYSFSIVFIFMNGQVLQETQAPPSHSALVLQVVRRDRGICRFEHLVGRVARMCRPVACRCPAGAPELAQLEG